MKTLLLNPPSFEKFDGGASSRWPATREIESYWYPVWLGYPAAMIKESRLLDAPPHHIGPEETIGIAADYDFVVFFTSTAGFQSDVRMAEAMKSRKPDIKIAFVGPHVSVLPEKSLRASEAIDFVTHKEFDFAVTDFAAGKPLDQIPGVHFLRDGKLVSTQPNLPIENLDALPWVAPVYKRDLDMTKYNVPFLLHPYLSFYTTRGCPAKCTFCLWPQTMSGHPWRTRSPQHVAGEVEYVLQNFKGLKEIFFDDDTFTFSKGRVLEICQVLKPLKFTWSCTSRVLTDYETLRAMKDAGCRLLIVGFESGDDQILKNIKKGANVETARRFVKDAKRAGIVIHGDFIIGLPGETKETIRQTIKFAKELDCETIQVSVAHAYPGTELYDYFMENNLLSRNHMADEAGHQLPMANFPHLSGVEMLEAVEKFYGDYYFRPKVAARIVRKAIFKSDERKRLYKEAREYLSLRAKRRQIVRSGQL